MMAENNLKMLKIQQCVVANKLPRNRPYVCNICFKHFETPSKLARHYLIHTGQKPFECDVCHKTFRQLVHLERHQLTHNLPFKCSICQRHFKNLKTFVKHQQLHNETYQNDVKQVRRLLEAKQEKPGYGMYHTFSTEERWALHPCSKSDPTYGPTKKRKNIHACTICGKMFPSQSKLDRHALIHTGQRPFKCVLCSKSFRQSTHLKIHQLTHSEERPFQCCFCQKGFKIQSKLLKHKQIHTRNKTFQTLSLKVKSPESCSLPNKLNAKQDGFENGVIGESEENNQLDVHSIYIVPFQCPECEECFESEQIFNGHKCFPARGGKIPSRLKRSYNYKTVVKKILAKLKRAGGKKLDNFRSEKKVFKNSFLKNSDLISGEQSPEQTQRTFMGSLGKHGTYKTVGNKKKKTLTLPFSWQKHLQSQNMGKNLKGVLSSENMLTMDNSVNNKDISIYGSSGDNVTYNASQQCQTLGFQKYEMSESDQISEIKVKAESEDFILGTRYRNRQPYLSGALLESEQSHHSHCFSYSGRSERNDGLLYQCSVCSKSFRSPSKLERHYLIHAGQKPFECSVCGKTFRQAPHWKRHQLTHFKE
ncbi:hypothetical protein HPG69_002022 [Diceros bicornis minor]|uniref:Zinc finger protein 770 n=1 Tax=Diceros bicornis minor TaxID=77932 RepID=A0A7J7FBY8_DICBM|nr:hypothetical protein HPG69_002022 [Diceros bicornis minor]